MDNRRVNQPRNWPESINKTTFLCLNFGEGRTFQLCKENPTHTLPLSHSSGNNREHTAGSSVGNFCPRRSLVSAHQMCPTIFQMKIFGCGCSKECIQMAWWQKIDKIESSDKISSQESLKTCTKKNFTHTQKLSRAPDRSAFFRIC